MSEDRVFWLQDGQYSWESGVDSNKPPTIASQEYPEGLKRTQSAWGGNVTFRGGRISPRSGLQPLAQPKSWPGNSRLFQGAYMYEPNGGDPYIIMGVGGHTFQIRVDTDNSIHDLTTGPTVRNANLPQWWLCQGEQFLIIQDNADEASVWDGNSLQRISVVAGPQHLPVGNAMDYFMGRLWLALSGGSQRQYMAGDIVRGPSGSGGYGLTDSILHNSENAYLAGGGAFIVPANDGTIRAIFHTAELDTSLGQGRLYVGTRKTIYGVNVPITRTDWNAASNVNIPLQTVAQQNFGPVNDRSVVRINGDAFYQSLEPSIRSLTLAVRYFKQWGNTQISSNENRVLGLNDRALLRYASGIQFDNRLLQTCLPFQTVVGVAHRGVIPLDFNLINSLAEQAPPAWEGMNEGLQILQMLEGDFGGRQRGFAIVLGQNSEQIEIWEITRDGLRDNGDNRISWYFETPAYTFKDMLQLKRLRSGQIWYDNIVGTVQFTVEYRPDSAACWTFWHAWEDCNARTCVEAEIPCGYPVQPLCPGNKSPGTFPQPPSKCDPSNNRPSDFGYQFQCRVTVKGSCQIKGFFLYAEKVDQAPYQNVLCSAVTA